MIALPQISPRLRRPLMLAGYPLFALAVAAVTVFVTLPRDRIKDKVESTLSADPMSGVPGALGMDTSIGDLGLTLFTGAGVKLTNLVLRSRPTVPDEKPARYVIDEATVKAGLLGLLFNRPTYSFDIRVLSGSIIGELGMSPSQQTIDIDAEGLVLSSLQAIRAAIGLPIEGTLSLKIDAVAPKGLAANLDGTLAVTIDGAVIGDDKAKLKIPGTYLATDGITFPRIRLGKISGRVVMEKGRARLEDLAAHSPDVDITIDGYLELRDPIRMSQLHGYLKFRPSEELLKRAPSLEIMTGALSSAKRPDGYFGFQLSGPLMSIFPMPSPNPPPGVNVKSGPPRLSTPSTIPHLSAPVRSLAPPAAMPPPAPPPAAPPPTAAPPEPPAPPPEPPAEEPAPSPSEPREEHEAPAREPNTREAPLSGRLLRPNRALEEAAPAQENAPRD